MRRRALAVGVVTAATAAVVVAGLAVALPGRGGVADTPGLRVAERPVGMVDLTALAWPAGAAGECLVQQPGEAALAEVDCSDPHDLERIGGGRLAGPPDAAFPDTTIDVLVDAECRDVLRRTVSNQVGALPVAIAVTQPSAGTWLAGDRGFHCFVGVPGRRLVGGAMSPAPTVPAAVPAASPASAH